MSAHRPALGRLAERLGILSGYEDVEGRWQPTSDATREALVAAMGHQAHDEAAAARSLERLEAEAAEQLLEPVLVWRDWEPGRPELALNPRALPRGADYRLEMVLEDGRRECSEGRLPAELAADALMLPLPSRPPFGYHELHLQVDAPGRTLAARQRLLVTPRTVLQPEARLGPRRAWGLWLHPWALRSRDGWGRGGLRELAAVGRFAAAAGASFVGTTPLHAVSNRGLDFAPYSPASRLYRDVLLIDPEAVPELERSPSARARLDEPGLRARRAALEAAGHIDHEAVLEAMLPVLRELHASFRRDAIPQRRLAYERYLEGEGRLLRDFATWEVLAQQQAAPGGPPQAAWWRWPRPLRDPDDPAVQRFRTENAEAVDFRCWLQFELDRQLGEVARGLAEAGCEIGLYQDMALGSSRASADAWMAPALLARDVEVGAPPDAYAPEGQNWGFPPFDPHRLRSQAYAPWTRLLRATLAHAGALRLDHAMSLQRLFWIPRGGSARDGAYVRYRAEELLGVLALESHRHRALVVAEDLGTLPDGLPALLEDWGLLRSAVLFFARDGERYRPPTSYPARALASVGTHDLAPLAGFVRGVDLELRRAAGAIASDSALRDERRQRQAVLSGLLDALRAESLLDADGEPDDLELRDAVHRFLAATPAVLLGVSLDDLAGEREPLNLPGVPLDRHRSWSRRMAQPLEELLEAPGLRAALEPLRSRSRPEKPGRDRAG